MEFVRQHVLGQLTVAAPVGSMALHPTCPSLMEIAQSVTEDVFVPLDWGCCAFAGDRRLLHPELTDSAAESQAREITSAGSTPTPPRTAPAVRSASSSLPFLVHDPSVSAVYG